MNSISQLSLDPKARAGNDTDMDSNFPYHPEVIQEILGCSWVKHC